MTIAALNSQVWSKTWIRGWKIAFVIRPAMYICLVLAAVIASYSHWIRTLHYICLRSQTLQFGSLCRVLQCVGLW